MTGERGRVSAPRFRDLTTRGADTTNPDACKPQHVCVRHAQRHTHGPNCGHKAVPHGDHVDYLVDGHLHHPHGDHWDNHGPVSIKK